MAYLEEEGGAQGQEDEPEEADQRVAEDHGLQPPEDAHHALQHLAGGEAGGGAGVCVFIETKGGGIGGLELGLG